MLAGFYVAAFSVFLTKLFFIHSRSYSALIWSMSFLPCPDSISMLELDGGLLGVGRGVYVMLVITVGCGVIAVVLA